MGGPRVLPVRLAFGALALASLVLLSVVDDTAARVVAPLGHYRVASLTVCLLLTLGVQGPAALGPPRPLTPWPGLVRLSLLWLGGTAVAIFVVKVWTPTERFRDAADYVAFLGTGLLAEELLFRGALFHLAERTFAPATAAVWTTALLFAASHAQYHHFRVSPALATQLAYTIPTGLALGVLRQRSGSLWPGVLLHLLQNLISVIRT